MRIYPPFAYAIVKATTWTFLSARFSLKVSGQENVPRHGPLIFASNHASHLDPVVLGCSSPRRVTFMARNTLWNGFWMTLFMDSMECIPLRRGESDVWAIREAVRRLRKGAVLGLYPEGTRSEDGRLGKAKRGIGLLATLAKVPIVPVVVTGTREALPKGAKGLGKSKIRVAFGKPIPYTTDPAVEAGKGERNADTQDQLAEAVTRSWQTLLANLKDSSHGTNPGRP